MKKQIGYAAMSLLLASSTVALCAPPNDDSIDARWDAALNRDGVTIPFRLDISGSGPKLQGTLYDGFKPYEHTTKATFQNGQLVLGLEHYLTTITADLKDGQLQGFVVSQGRSGTSQYLFRATRHAAAARGGAAAPSIAGSWVIPLETPSSKGEKAFRFIVEQHGSDVAAAILRVDGDTGSYSGSYSDGKWLLSHFDGSRPGLIVVSLTDQGTLKILQSSDRVEKPASGAGTQVYDDSIADGRYAPTLTAYRAEVARAKGLPEPEDYEAHTTARDSNEAFQFNFPDVDGKLVSNEDPRFAGKVVLAIVTGTWCPNCHDEAQYLVQLDKKYRKRGLAIVALDFEEPEQQGNLARERAFVKQYGVKYTYLIAGAPAQMWEKVPQLVNLNTWPATIFVGRDGRVKAVHSGFASPASGDFHRELEQEFTSRIEKLLAEKPAIQAAAFPLASAKQRAAALTRSVANRG
jgi:thiol-disulfide isomerase/thioredoxin